MPGHVTASASGGTKDSRFVPLGHQGRQAAGAGVRADAALGTRGPASSVKTRRSRPGRWGSAGAARHCPRRPAKRTVLGPGTSPGRGGTRPRTLSLGLDAPSGARLPRTAGCCAARPVTRHPAALPGPAAGLLCVSPARRPGACPLTLPLRAHGAVSAPCPRHGAGCRAKGLGSRRGL